MQTATLNQYQKHVTANAKYIVTQDRHYDVVRFKSKYDFTAIDIDYSLDYLQKTFDLYG